VIFDKSSELVICEDAVIVLSRSNTIHQPRNRPADYSREDHAAPNDWPAVVAPCNSLSRYIILRDNLRKDGEQESGDNNGHPDRSVVQSLDHERKRLAASNRAYD
jgi:hypothetical protein